MESDQIKWDRNSLLALSLSVLQNAWKASVWHRLYNKQLDPNLMKP